MKSSWAFFVFGHAPAGTTWNTQGRSRVSPTAFLATQVTVPKSRAVLGVNVSNERGPTSLNWALGMSARSADVLSVQRNSRFFCGLALMWHVSSRVSCNLARMTVTFLTLTQAGTAGHERHLLRGYKKERSTVD